MAKMTKSQFISSMADMAHVSKKDASDMWDKFVELAYKEVRSNGEFNIPGLGKLVKKQRAARVGRNPLTGATINIPAKIVVKFRVAKAAKDALL